MNWQLISFFGDSTVLQHSARFSAGLQKQQSPPACINAALAQHLTDCPATGCATTESMESLTRLRNSILCTLTGRFTCA